ncbi:MAG: hypothetical protein ABIB71_05100 [Candidatus Woesearchaeota archaeon]
MRKALIILIICILLPTLASAKCPGQKEGYAATEDCMTIYNITHIKEIFGEDNVVGPLTKQELAEIRGEDVFAPIVDDKKRVMPPAGYIAIYHSSNKKLLLLNGTILATPAEKKLKIKGSAQIAVQAGKGIYDYRALVSGEELSLYGFEFNGKGVVRKYNITTVKEGSFFPINDEESKIAFKAKEFGVYYTNSGKDIGLKLLNATAYLFKPFGESITLDCTLPIDDQCRISVWLAAEDETLSDQYTRIFGRGKLIDSLVGKGKLELDIANLEIDRIVDKKYGSLEFASTVEHKELSQQGLSQFGPLEFHTEEKAAIGYTAGKLDELHVYLVSGEEPVYLVDISGGEAFVKLYAAYPENQDGIIYEPLVGSGLNIKSGAYFIAQDQSEKGFYLADAESNSPLFSLQGMISISNDGYLFHLKDSEFTYHGEKKEWPAIIELTNSYASEVRNIEIAEIRPGEKSKLKVKLEGVPNANMVFKYDDVVVNGKDINWYDFGFSFKTSVYDKNAFSYRKLECDIATKSCTLDGNPISSLKDLKKPSKCSADDDCGPGKKCVKPGEKAGVCASGLKCELLFGEDNPQGKLDILIIGDGFDSDSEFEDSISSFMGIDMGESFNIDEGSSDPIGELSPKEGGFFSVSPFQESIQKFALWKSPVVDVEVPLSEDPDSSGYAVKKLKSSLSQKNDCPQIDQTVVISKTDVWAWANNNMVFVSSIKDNGLVLAHEFGHTFGDLRDEYRKPSTYKPSCQAGAPNCIPPKSATKVWSAVLGNEEGKALAQMAAESEWLGCGGWCKGETYSSYLKPSENSIMGSYASEGGGEFNSVCKAELEKRLEKYA